MSNAGDEARGRGKRTRQTGRNLGTSRRSGLDDPGGLPEADHSILGKDGIPTKLAVSVQERAALFGADREQRATYCTCAMLRRASRRVTQVYDQALKPYGLRLNQYSLLANLLRSEGLSITELAERLDMERTTLTRNLKPLESAGWLRVKAGPDRRSRALEITPAGQTVVEQAFPAWQQAERSFRKSMGREEAAELRQLLGTAMSAID